MLVLTRKIGESIIIGDTIRVTVQDIGQGRVKLGVVAPPAVRVDREEIRERKLAEAAPAPGEPDSEDAIPLPHNRIAAQLPNATPRPHSVAKEHYLKKPR